MYRLSAKYLKINKFATVLTFVYDDTYSEIFLSYINIINNIKCYNKLLILYEISDFIIHSIINTIYIDDNIKQHLYNECSLYISDMLKL